MVSVRGTDLTLLLAGFRPCQYGLRAAGRADAAGAHAVLGEAGAAADHWLLEVCETRVNRYESVLGIDVLDH